MKLRSHWPLSILAALLASLSLAGCQSNQPTNHQKAVNNATQHWRGIRSGMMLQMAQRQFDAGDLDQAERSLTDAFTADPKNAALYVLAGRIAVERGQLEKAYHMFELAISFNAQAADAHYYEGLVFQRWQQYEQAREQYTQAYALRSDDPAYLLAVCEMLVALDRTDEAQKLLIEKTTYFDENAGVRQALGQIYLMKKDYRQAAECFHQAELLRPDDYSIQEDLGTALLESGQTEQAIPYLNKLAGQAGYVGRRDIQRMLGAAYDAAGRPADALAVYLKLTQNEPNDTDAWIKFGRTCWVMNDTTGTALAAQRVMALAPHQYEGYLLAGMADQRIGKTEQALRMLDRAAELAPDSAQPLLVRGLTLEQAGRAGEAAQAYTEALKRQPNDANARKLLAQVAGRS